MTRRLIVAAVALLAVLVAAQSFAAAPTAREFVEAIYANYKGKSDTMLGIRFERHEVAMQYFEPSLVKMIERDRRIAERKHEAPRLDGDPFMGAQDWDVAAFDIRIEEVKNKATATVSFKNFGEARTVVLSLVKLKAGWRIHDIKYATYTLRGTLTAK